MDVVSSKMTATYAHHILLVSFLRTPCVATQLLCTTTAWSFNQQLLQGRLILNRKQHITEML